MSDVIAVAPEVRTAVLLTHTQPEQTAAAVADAIAAAERAGCRLFVPTPEREKHGAAAEGLEPTAERSTAARPLPGPRRRRDDPARRCARTRAPSVPVFGGQLRHGRLPRGGRARRPRRGPGRRLRRRVRGDVAARARGRASTPNRRSPSTTSPDPPPARPRGRARLQPRRQGGGPRPLRRAGRRDARGVDGLQPRQPGPDPRLGRRGLRRQLHRPAHAHRAGRWWWRPTTYSRSTNAAGRDAVDVVARRRADRRARQRRRDGGPLPRRTSAASRSFPARTSTAGSARSSAAWPLGLGYTDGSASGGRCSPSAWRRSCC